MLKRRWGQRLKIVLFFLIAAAFFKGVKADHRIFGKWTTTQVQDLSHEVDKKYAELKAEVDNLRNTLGYPNLSNDVNQLKIDLENRVKALEQLKIDKENQKSVGRARKFTRTDKLFKNVEELSNSFKSVDQKVQLLQNVIKELQNVNLNLSPDDLEKLRFLIDDVVSN